MCIIASRVYTSEEKGKNQENETHVVPLRQLVGAAGLRRWSASSGGHGHRIPCWTWTSDRRTGEREKMPIVAAENRVLRSFCCTRLMGCCERGVVQQRLVFAATRSPDGTVTRQPGTDAAATSAHLVSCCLSDHEPDPTDFSYPTSATAAAIASAVTSPHTNACSDKSFRLSSVKWSASSLTICSCSD